MKKKESNYHVPQFLLQQPLNQNLTFVATQTSMTTYNFKTQKKRIDDLVSKKHTSIDFNYDDLYKQQKPLEISTRPFEVPQKKIFKLKEIKAELKPAPTQSSFGINNLLNGEQITGDTRFKTQKTFARSTSNLKGSRLKNRLTQLKPFLGEIRDNYDLYSMSKANQSSIDTRTLPIV